MSPIFSVFNMEIAIQTKTLSKIKFELKSVHVHFALAEIAIT